MADRPLDDCLLNGEKLTARLSAMVTAATLERTMEGPSTLRLSLWDPDYWLTRQSGILGERGFRTTATWLQRSFTLAQLDKTETGFDLEFIITAAAVLSRRKPHGKTDWRKTSRDRLTRARAASAVCRFLDVDFAEWGGVDLKQPIESFTRQERRQIEDAQATDEAQAKTRQRISRGSLNGKGITVKGAKATREQLRNIEIAMSVADRFGAPVKATVAMLVAGIAEGGFRSDIRNYETGDATGPWQILASTAAALGIRDRTDVAVGAEAFLVGLRVNGRLMSFNGGPGAITLSRQHPELSGPDLANLIEAGGAGPGFYAPYVDEAYKIIRARSRNGAISDDDITPLTGTPDRVRRGRYEFRVEPGESYYEALLRWAEEVRWRFFIIDTPEHPEGWVWFIDDLTLARATPSAVIAEGDRGVDRILYSRTRSGRIDQLTVQGRAQITDYTPGQCIVVNGEGEPADGRWLVRSITHDLLDELHTVTVTLGQPQAPKPEPKPSLITSAGTPADTEDPRVKRTIGAKVTGNELTGTPKDIIDTLVLPVGRRYGLKSALGAELTPSNVAAANSQHGSTTYGGRSDHQGPPSTAWAVDMSNGWMTPDERKCARELADMFDIPWSGTGIQSVTRNGYRFQLIWGINLGVSGGGEHRNHIHFGVGRA